MEGGLLDEAEQEPKIEDPMIKEVVGDLFNAPQSHSLALDISKDGRMNEGIAKQFREHFGRVKEIKQQKVEVGCVTVVREGPRLTYNLIIKEM